MKNRHIIFNKNIKKITGILFLVLFMFRVIITVTGIIHRNPPFFNNTIIMNYFDAFISIILFYYLTMTLPDEIIKSNKRYYLLLILLIGLAVEGILQNFYTFEKPANASIYYRMNKDNTLLLYEDKQISILVDEEPGFSCLTKKDKVWKLSDRTFNLLQRYETDDYTLKIYREKGDYFIYLVLSDKIEKNNISDNSNVDFITLTTASLKPIKTKNHYGKIVQDIENYVITIDDKQITYDDIKKENNPLN